jgi:hypothetical protein
MSRARVLIGLRDLGLGRQDYGHGLGVNGWNKPPGNADELVAIRRAEVRRVINPANAGALAFNGAEDVRPSADLVPAEASKPEPIEALTNQGEFPTLVDQGEGIAPGEPQTAGNPVFSD